MAHSKAKSNSNGDRASPCFKPSLLATDTIFTNNTRINSYDVTPIINGLSDLIAQYLTLKNIFISNKNGNTASIK